MLFLGWHKAYIILQNTEYDHMLVESANDDYVCCETFHYLNSSFAVFETE